MNKVRPSKETEIKIVEEFQNGTPKKYICEEFNIVAKTIDRILDKYGIDSKKLIRFDKKNKKKAQEMAINGASDVEISEVTGISLNLASQYVKRVEKEMDQITKNSMLIKAIPIERTRRFILDETKYLDITDYVAGI